LPFFVALFIASGKGSLWNPVAWPNTSFRASEVNSGTHITLSSQRQFMKVLWRKGGASFWAAGCGVIRAQGLAPHGLRVLEAARAPQGGVPSASGWVGPLDALQALDTTPGPVSLRCLPGIAPVLLRYLPGVSPMLMPSTWEIHRGDTGDTPCLLAWGYAGGGPGILNSEKGTRHRPPRR
jgi:hypothetical protein